MKQKFPGKIRRATVRDAKGIHELLEIFATRNQLLRRPLVSIYSCIRDFHVCEHPEDHSLLGICALHVCWEELAEIRSFCVRDEYSRQGIGRALLRACLSDCRQLGITKVFVLTYLPRFFIDLGFKEIEKSKLPQKIWADCIQCVKFPACDEVALIRELR